VIIAVTPTGDRLRQFEICYDLMMRQTVLPDKWIIIDDGVQKLQNIVDGKINNIEVIIINREASLNRITVKENIFAALDKINIKDKIIFFEDDDFYPNTYIETMSKLLDHYIVVGGLLRKYYNLNYQGLWEFKRPMFGTLNSTAFNATEKILKILYDICCNNSDGYDWDIDIEFWKEIKSEGISNFLHSEPKAQVIGVKGWNTGRKGAVSRVHRNNRRKYIFDPDFDILNNYFEDLSEKYKSFIKHGFLVDLWRSLIGCIYRIRAHLKGY
jgi:hypothetical protein